MKKVYTTTKLLFMAISISSLSLFAFNAKAQGNGLLGIYYQDSYPFNLTSWTSSNTEAYAWNPPSNITWFTTLITSRVDATINIPKGSLESFLPSVSGINPNAPVSIQWKGDIIFGAAGAYTFYLSGADGLRLKINNNAIIGNFAQGDPAWVVRPYLETGTNYLPLTGYFTVSQNQVNIKIPIIVEFYSVGTTSNSSLSVRGIKLEWESANLTREIIPQSALYAASSKINDIADDKIIQVYPSPSSQSIQVDIRVPNNNQYTLSIYDMQGNIIFNQLINQQNVSKQSIDISSFSAGMYFVKLTGNNINIVKQIIKN